MPPVKQNKNSPGISQRQRTSTHEESAPRRDYRAKQHDKLSRPAAPKPPRREKPPVFREATPFQPSQNDDLPALVPGLKPVLELLESTPERVDCVFLRKGRHKSDADVIIDLCRTNKVRFSLQDQELFAKHHPGSNQGVVARLFSTGFIEYDTLLDNVMDAPLPLILALDQVQDPGNAGTLARTLYALGGAGIVLPKHNGVFLGGAALKAAAGALEKLPVARAGNLGQAIDEAKKRGFTIYGTQSLQEAAKKETRSEPEELSLYQSVPRLPALLVLGSEETGMREHVGKRCDILLGIPMLRRFDSFNVAQAGAMVLSWFVYQHSR